MHKPSSDNKVSTSMLLPPGYVEPDSMNRLVITRDAVTKLSLRWLLLRQLNECINKELFYKPYSFNSTFIIFFLSWFDMGGL